MNKTIASAALALGLLVGTAGPSFAADPIEVNVDSFVVPNPSLDGCDIGNGIHLAGDVGEHVHWSLNGQQLNITPQQRTLWFPAGFTGTVTAVADPGYVLREFDAGRSATTLTWEHTVAPCVAEPQATPQPQAVPAAPVTTPAGPSASDYRARIAALTVRVSHLRLHPTRNANKIQKLRTQIKQLRAELHAL